MQINGFLLVKPPLFEFESSLFFLLNEKEESNSFRVLDPISKKMMELDQILHLNSKNLMWFLN